MESQRLNSSHRKSLAFALPEREDLCNGAAVCMWPTGWSLAKTKAAAGLRFQAAVPSQSLANSQIELRQY